MKYIILITTCVCIMSMGLNAQNYQEIESPIADVLSLNSTGSSTTVLNFLNSNAALTGGSNKRAYMSTNGNILNLGLSNNNTGGRIEFFGQGLRRMTMNADGRFGIGNIIPTQQLDVDGQVKIRDLPAAADTDSYVTADASGNLRKKSAAATTYAVGDFAQGGVVFWVSPSGEHGKVVSIYDVGGDSWSNITTTAIGPIARSDINGAGNTVSIISQSGHTNSVAQHCADLAYAGYDDWYLPSKNELNQVYLKRADINPTATANGGEVFETSTSYWSSTESNDTKAWVQSLSSGFQSEVDKLLPFFAVRPIRAF